MPSVSIIVPIYSVQNYISECVTSLLSQDYDNFEIILVDDGSPDESPAICDNFAKKFDKIKVIHKENGGLSDARNAGIKVATGDYLTFCDGDDFWDDETALSRLVQRISLSKADVLNFSYKKFFEDTQEKTPYFDNIPAMPLTLTAKTEQLRYITDNHLYIASACNKLIKRELFDNNLYFEKGVYSEDITWCAKLLCYAKSMDFICENFYCYRQRSGSITHTVNDRKCKDLCDHIIECIDIFKSADSETKHALGYYSAYQYATFFKVQADAENPQEKCIELLRDYSWLLSHHNGSKKIWALNIACKFLGVQSTCKLIRFFNKQN